MKYAAVSVRYNHTLIMKSLFLEHYLLRLQKALLNFLKKFLNLSF